MVDLGAGQAERLGEVELGAAVGGQVLDQEHALARLQITFDLSITAETLWLFPDIEHRQGEPIGDPGSEGDACGLAAGERFARLRAGIESSIAREYAIELPYELGLVAEAHLTAGRLDDARRALDDALERSQRTAERWFDPEIHRLRAKLGLAGPGSGREDVLGDLERALEVARSMQARFFELRAARDLARFWAEQDRRAEAHDLLAPIYGWFTEGFDTDDLLEAKALLDQLR